MEQEVQGNLVGTRTLLIATAAIVAIALAVVAAVGSVAWVADDSFYSLRYVSNALAGYGAVYNIGEYVQGYTHPLWFMTLLTGSFVFGDPILVAIGLGLLFTLITVVGLGLCAFWAARDQFVGLYVFALGVAVLVSSDPWLSFQTSGLENSLSHLLIFLIVALCFFYQVGRPASVVLLLTLLCLCRPDFVFLGLPLGLLAARETMATRAYGRLLLAMLPGVLWLLFAWLYYGDPLPNTGAAKLAIFPSWGAALAQGFRYLTDWFIYDTVAVVAMAGCLVYAALKRRDLATRALILGMVLQLLWVIFIGGDFMQGRFYVAVLTGSVALGVLVLAEQCAEARPQGLRFLGSAFAALLVIGVAGLTLRPPLVVEEDWKKVSIVNERQYSFGYSLRSYLRLGYLDPGPIRARNIEIYGGYVAACGSATVHLRNPALAGYVIGPKLTLIDTLGLTDRYIARLPKTYLADAVPRPGHPDKYIPIDYLAERSDIALVPGWYEKMADKDCTLPDQIGDLSGKGLFMTPDNRIVRLTFPDA
jgi:arabinofuranosyltransferase